MIRPFCCLRGWVRPSQGALYRWCTPGELAAKSGEFVGRNESCTQRVPHRLWRSSLLAAVVAIPELGIDPNGRGRRSDEQAQPGLLLPRLSLSLRAPVGDTTAGQRSSCDHLRFVNHITRYRNEGRPVFHALS